MSSPLRSLRMTTVGLVATAIVVFATLKPSGTRAVAPAPQVPSLDKLRQERIETLDSAAKLADQLYSRGLGTLEESLRCHKMLVDARLDAATTAKERADILTDALADAKTQEESANQREKAGLATQLDSLEAKACRLQIEISMATEGAK